MERLSGNCPTFMLEEQYRMHPAMCEVISSAFYKGRLRTADITSAARRHPLPACFVQAGGEEEKEHNSFFNRREVEHVVDMVRLAVAEGHNAQGDVNVITFYNAQKALIQESLEGHGLGAVDVLSVDAMQGREVNVVFLSCVRSSAGQLG